MPAELEVAYYETSDMKRPAREWLLSFRDKKVKARIDAGISRLRSGLAGNSSSVGGGVWEWKYDFGPGYRLYYGIESGRVILLLCGGDKKTQNSDIAAARKYWQDHKERRNK